MYQANLQPIVHQPLLPPGDDLLDFQVGNRPESGLSGGSRVRLPVPEVIPALKEDPDRQETKDQQGAPAASGFD